VQLFQILLANPVTVALLYRPPKHNSEFINEFAAFLGDIVIAHDKILLIGDFNIHVCCTTLTLSREFLNLIESFDLVQWVTGPTHQQGHTLDLILTHGLSVSDITISNANFSDHMPVLFSVPYSGQTLNNQSMRRMSRNFTTSSIEEFKVAFNEVWNSSETGSTLHNLDVDEHLSYFNSTCASILNSIAPLKRKSVPIPWLN